MTRAERDPTGVELLRSLDGLGRDDGEIRLIGDRGEASFVTLLRATGVFVAWSRERGELSEAVPAPPASASLEALARWWFTVDAARALSPVARRRAERWFAEDGPFSRGLPLWDAMTEEDLVHAVRRSLQEAAGEPG